MKDFKHDFTSMLDECNCPMVSTFFSTTLLGNWDEDQPFPVMCPLLGLPYLLTCWMQHIDGIILYGFELFYWNSITSTSFINSSASKGPPDSHSSECLALGAWPHCHSNLVHLDFLYSSSMYSFHLFLISSASTKSLPFISFIVPIFGQNLPLISPIFLKRSLVFPLLLFSSVIKHCSLKKAFLSLLAIFWNSVLLNVTFSCLPCFLLFLILLLFVKPPQITRFLFLFFFPFVEIFSVYDVCFQEGVGHVGWNVQKPFLLNLWFLISPGSQDQS